MRTDVRFSPSGATWDPDWRVATWVSASVIRIPGDQTSILFAGQAIQSVQGATIRYPIVDSFAYNGGGGYTEITLIGATHTNAAIDLRLSKATVGNSYLGRFYDNEIVARNAAGITISSAAPTQRFTSTGSGADAKNWVWRAGGNNLALYPENDAGALGTAAFTFTRAANSITALTINPATTFNAAVTIAGLLTANSIASTTTMAVGTNLTVSGNASVAGATTLASAAITAALTVGGIATFNGQTIAVGTQAWRQVSGNYGSFFLRDALNLYLVATASGDQYGNATVLRPFQYNLSTGDVTLGTNVQIAGSLNVTSAGTTTIANNTTISGALSVTSIPVFSGGNGGAEGGEIRLLASTAATFSGNAAIDTNNNRIRFFESGGSQRGAFIDVTTCGNIATSEIWHNGNFDPTTKYDVAGGVLTGQSVWYNGTINTQSVKNVYGWSNNVQRWAWVLEANQSLSLFSYNTAGGVPTTTLNIRTPVAGGASILKFLGNTVWHAGNLDPTVYLNKTGDTASGRIIFQGVNSTATIATATGSLGAIEIQATGPNVPMLAFHRGGTYAVYLGLGTDNNLSIGGWSMGAVVHKIWHGNAGNLATANSVTVGGFTANGGANFNSVLSVDGAATFNAGATTTGVHAFLNHITVVGNITSQGALNMQTNTNHTIQGTLSVSQLIAGTSVRATQLFANGGFTEIGQGGHIAWNVGGGGLMCFLNHRGGGSGGFRFYNGLSGTYTLIVQFDSAGNIQSLSDKRTKTAYEVIPMATALAFVQDVDGYYYRSTLAGAEEYDDMGFFSQDVNKHEKRLTSVSTDKNHYMSLNYLKIPTLHHMALKYCVEKDIEQDGRIAELEQQLRNARSRLEALEG